MSQPQTTLGTHQAGPAEQQLAGPIIPSTIDSAGACLVAAIAGLMRSNQIKAEGSDTDTDSDAPDAELLRQCGLVNEIGAVPPTIDEAAWTEALLRVGYTSPHTLAGLRAKVEIALMLLPLPSVPGGDRDDVQDRLLWLVLRDVIRIIDRARA